MSKIYRAFANEKEITNFYVDGKDAAQIWGGNTLLWERQDDKPPMQEICSIRTTWTQVTDAGIQYPCECEISVRNQTEDGSKYFTNIEKAGIYTKQGSGTSSIWTTYWEDGCIMFKADLNPKEATYYMLSKNVKRTLRRWNTDGELLDETTSWEYSENYNHMENIFGVGVLRDGVYSTTLRPLNYGPGPSTVNFRAEIYTSGSGEFKSAEDVLEYMLE